MRNIRSQMIAGSPVNACARCYAAEETFGTSLRTFSNQRWAAELGLDGDRLVDQSVSNGFELAQLPIYYQLMPGNLCNLKCRMCFPEFSSMIEHDPVHRRWAPAEFRGPPSRSEQEKHKMDPDREFGSTLGELPHGPWYRDDAWVRDVLLRNAEAIRCLYFTGGEPMIENQVENILEYLIERGVQENVSLEFNTNCTVLRDSMLEKLQQFKRVVLSLSLDAYGVYHEYIRYPSRWSKIHHNVERLVALRSERLQLCAAPVLQIYNALNFVEILRYLDQMDIHYAIEIASMPWFLSVDRLPTSVRQVAAEKLRVYAGAHRGTLGDHIRSVATYLESTADQSNEEWFRTLMLFTNDLDRTRNQSFSAVHSELVSLLKYCGFEWTEEHSVAVVPGAEQGGPTRSWEIAGPELVAYAVQTVRRWMLAVTTLAGSFFRFN